LGGQFGCGVQGGHHLYAGQGGVRFVGFLGHSCVTYRTFLNNLFFFEVARLGGRGLHVGVVLGYAVNDALGNVFT